MLAKMPVPVESHDEVHSMASEVNEFDSAKAKQGRVIEVIVFGSHRY